MLTLLIQAAIGVAINVISGLIMALIDISLHRL
jgi:hypothetical protein